MRMQKELKTGKYSKKLRHTRLNITSRKGFLAGKDKELKMQQEQL
jgi:hypothetical protein